MVEAAIIAVLVLMVVGCAVKPPPALNVRDVFVRENGRVHLVFSTDQLSREEAQEVLLLASALMVRRAGSERFQFRTVRAQGVVDADSGAVRYYDVNAIVDPLREDATGDPARKTYQVDLIVEALAARYRPLLPPALIGLGSGSG